MNPIQIINILHDNDGSYQITFTRAMWNGIDIPHNRVFDDVPFEKVQRLNKRLIARPDFSTSPVFVYSFGMEVSYHRMMKAVRHD